MHYAFSSLWQHKKPPIKLIVMSIQPGDNKNKGKHQKIHQDGQQYAP